MFLAFELKNSKLPKPKELLEKGWSANESEPSSDDEKRKATVSKTAERLTGVVPEKNKLVKSLLIGPTTTVKGEKHDLKIKGKSKALKLDSVQLYRIKSANSVIVFGFEYESLQGIGTDFRRLKGKGLTKLVKSVVESTECIDDSNSVYCIVGTSYRLKNEDIQNQSPRPSKKDVWHPPQEDGWLHITDHYVYPEVVRALVAQVAIERSILNSALVHRSNFVVRLFAAPIVGRRIRKWPVEFLFDLKNLTESYRSFRESLNIPTVRKEQLEKSKHWWTVCSALAAVLALVSTFILWAV